MLKLSEVLEDNRKFRIDAEFFAKDARSAYEALRSHRRFGDLVLSGYRVIYENTQIIPREEGAIAGLPFFLQAADIETPFIRPDGMGCVSRGDWERYPRGRIVPGEVLIEVKGLAEKVSLVPHDIPLNTLVTGTCYKMQTRDPLDARLLIAFLASRHGQALKNRLKSNLLVAFISKEDLFGMPVPDFGHDLKTEIAKLIDEAFAFDKRSTEKLSEAEGVLAATLGLESWVPPDPPTYILSFSRVFEEKRLDAEFHRPRVEALRSALSAKFPLKQLGELGAVENGQTVPYDEEGNVPIIRSGDLSNIDDESHFLRARSDSPFYRLERGDVLVSSIGFGSIGKVQVFDKAGVFGTVSEVTVVRQDVLNPYFVASFLRSQFGQIQIDRHITGATGQLHLYKRAVRKFFVPVIPLEEQEWFETLARSAAAARAQARAHLDTAKRAVDIAIVASDAAALRFLREM